MFGDKKKTYKYTVLGKKVAFVNIETGGTWSNR